MLVVRWKLNGSKVIDHKIPVIEIFPLLDILELKHVSETYCNKRYVVALTKVLSHTNLALKQSNNITHKLKQELEGKLYIFTILILLSLMTIVWNLFYSHMRR